MNNRLEELKGQLATLAFDSPEFKEYLELVKQDESEKLAAKQAEAMASGENRLVKDSTTITPKEIKILTHYKETLVTKGLTPEETFKFKELLVKESNFKSSAVYSKLNEIRTQIGDKKLITSRITKRANNGTYYRQRMVPETLERFIADPISNDLPLGIVDIKYLKTKSDIGEDLYVIQFMSGVYDTKMFETTWHVWKVFYEEQVAVTGAVGNVVLKDLTVAH